MEPKIEKYLNQLESNDPVQIRLALKKLGNLKDESVLPQIKSFLEHNDRMVVFFAKSAVKKIETACQTGPSDSAGIIKETLNSYPSSEPPEQVEAVSSAPSVIPENNEAISENTGAENKTEPEFYKNNGNPEEEAVASPGDSVVQDVRGQIDLDSFITTQDDVEESFQSPETELGQQDSWLYNSPLNELEPPDAEEEEVFDAEEEFKQLPEDTISFENILEESGSHDTKLFPESSTIQESAPEEDGIQIIDDPTVGNNNNPFEDLLNSSWVDTDDISSVDDNIQDVSDNGQGFELLSSGDDADFFKNLDQFDVSIEAEDDQLDVVEIQEESLEPAQQTYADTEDSSHSAGFDAESNEDNLPQEESVISDISEDTAVNDDDNGMFGIPSTGPFADMSGGQNISIPQDEESISDSSRDDGMPDWWQPQDEDDPDYKGKPYSPSFGKKGKK